MKHFISKLPRKMILAITSGIAVATVSAGVLAWGPARQTYTMAKPADHVVFNSITDNPREGDERAFFEAKSAANTQPNGFSHTNKVTDGEEVMLRVYVHNNAATSLNDAAHNFKGVAKNTQVRVWLPTVPATALRANAYVSADNAAPKEVYDNLDLYGDRAFTLEYVKGSAVAYNNAHSATTGMKLSDNIVSAGALLGYQNADGVVPGCLQFANVVTLKVKVHMPAPKVTITKQVALPGKPWAKSVDTTAGNTVSYLLQYKNIGTGVANDVIIRDQLPAHMHYVADSAKMFTGTYPNGNPIKDNFINGGGQDVGNYNPNIGGYITFKATIDQADKLACGANKMTNIAEASENHINPVTDTADVNVTKKCETVVVKRCDALSFVKVNRTRFDFNAKAYVENAAVTSYVFTSRDSSGKIVNTKTVNTSALNAKYTFNSIVVGDYSVSVVVNTNKGVADSGDCVKKVTVVEQPQSPTFECSALNIETGSNRKVTVTVSYKADGGATLKTISYDFGDSSTPLVTDQTPVSYNYKVDGSYTIKTVLTFSINGQADKQAICVGDVKVNTPTTPNTGLPNTGAGNVVGLFAGVSTGAAAAHYAIRSRRFGREG